MFPTNTPCLCHLFTKNLNIREEHSVQYFLFYPFFFKKVKFSIYIYLHIILAEKLLGLVICSGQIESLLITSPNISSTLNLVESIICFRLSI